MDRAGRDPRVPLITARSAIQSPAAAAGGAGAGSASARSAPAGSATAGTGTGTADPRRPVVRVFTAHPVAGQLTLVVCYLAAGVAVTWPRATYITGRLPSMRDSAAYVWGFWWMARRLSHLANPWVTNHMAAPAGVLLGYHTLMPLPGLLLTPVTLIFGPSASYNLLVILVPGLLCYAMYRAARLWLPSQTGAIAAGAFFGLSAMLAQEDWYHINIAVGALFLPLALEASVRLRRNPGWRQALILGVVVGAAVLTDPESAVLTGILVGLVLLPWLLWRPSVARLWPAALGAVAAAIVAGPQLAAMIHEQVRGGLQIDAQLLGVTDKLYGVGLPGMFAPTPRVANFGLTALAQPFLHSRDNEGLPMFGVTLTALALIGLAVAWRQRRAWQLAVLWVGCAALALGMSLWVAKRQFIPWMQDWHGVRVSLLMPYTWFVRIPGLSAFREADRMAILGLVPAALLAGMAVNWMRYHARPLIAVVIALGVLELGYAGNPKIGTMPTAYHRLDGPIAADHSASMVVDVPYGMRGGIPEYGGRFAAPALVMATADGHPRSVAYVSRIPASTLDAIERHTFYSWLIKTQHFTFPPVTVPLTPQAQQHRPLFARKLPSYTPLTAAEVAAGRRDARTLHIGWVVVWYSNPAVVQYLHETGFRFAYRADGVSVYRPVR
jgi:4-amino-4-deoxy-L-arabinose transferase-like glycosyltransferase